jgi:hypothetical protein
MVSLPTLGTAADRPSAARAADGPVAVARRRSPPFEQYTDPPGGQACSAGQRHVAGHATRRCWWGAGGPLLQTTAGDRRSGTLNYRSTRSAAQPHGLVRHRHDLQLDRGRRALIKLVWDPPQVRGTAPDGQPYQPTTPTSSVGT